LQNLNPNVLQAGKRCQLFNITFENGTYYFDQYQLDINTNAIQHFKGTIVPDWPAGLLYFHYEDRVSIRHFYAGDLINYVVTYVCVECNDYGDQGSK
jgi:hypothetical protein